MLKSITTTPPEPVAPIHVAAEGIGMLRGAASDPARLGRVQPLDKALPEQETREGEVRTAVEPSRVSELTEAAQEIVDLLHALDKIGDGIGGADGFAVSAVAINARSIADNLACSLSVMAGRLEGR